MRTPSLPLVPAVPSWRRPLPLALLPVGLTFALAATGCGPGDGDPTPQNDAGCVEDWYVPFLGEVPAAGGDLSCYGGTLENTAPAAACLSDVTLDGRTVDHQSRNPVGNMAVEVFFDNDASGTPDLAATSDADGNLDGTVPACQPVAYRTDRGDPDEARVTLAQHKVWTNQDPILEFDFRSVATGTVNLITSPLFFGVEIEAGKGMVFGKAVGCDYEALENLQVLVRDADCQVPDGSLVGYTTNELPDPGARATTPDGFFFGMNVPPGDWVLEMYRAVGDGFELVGAAPATVEPDGVTLVDIFVGRDDGQVMPMECLCE